MRWRQDASGSRLEVDGRNQPALLRIVVQNPEVTLAILCHERSALNEVAIIGVEHIANPFDARLVNVSGGHPIHFAARRVGSDKPLELQDILHGTLSHALEVPRDGHVGDTELPGNPVEPAVQEQDQAVEAVPDRVGQELALLHRFIELVTVKDEKQSPISGAVDQVFHDPNTASAAIFAIFKLAQLLGVFAAPALASLSRCLEDEIQAGP